MYFRMRRRSAIGRIHRQLTMEQIEPRQMLSGTELGGAGESLVDGQIPMADPSAGLVALGGLQTVSGTLLTGDGGSVIHGSLAEGELIDAPAAPHSLAATVVSASEINLTWSLGDETETAIVIERKSGSTGVFQTLATLPPAENTFTDTSCWAATSYTYRIKAVNGGGSSGFSSEQSAVTAVIPTGALTTVTGLQAIADSANSVTISFTDPNTADARRFYLLERSSDGVSYQVIKSLGTSATWTDVGRMPGASYYYRVRGASWNFNTSDYSAPAQVTMPNRLAGAPIEPSGLQANAAGATSITLAWTNNDPSNPAFRIDRAVFDNWHAMTWTTVATTAAGATSFTDVGLTPESAYVYRVSAVNAVASSGYAVPSGDVMQSLFGDATAAITASAGTGSPKVYDIGPAFSLKKIADLDWSQLGPGDTVNIHYKPEGYHELFMISTRGTAENWITVNGVPDPVTGALPVIDGLEAVLAPQFKSSYVDLHGGGAIIVGTRPGYADGYKAGYVTIQNLQIQRCYSGNTPNTFTDYNGAQLSYGRVGAGVYLYRADHVTIRNCVITDNGEGIFGAGQSGFDRLMTDITISSNHIFNNGNIGVDKQHNTYLEAIDTVYEFNQYGPMRSGAGGNGLKDRSVGVIVRGNYIEGGSHELQLVGAENQDSLAVTLPRYHTAIVYGNTLVDGPASVSGPIEYGGEVHSTFDRKGILYLYGNTIVVRSDKTSAWRVNAVNMPSTEETLDARNNIFAAVPPTPGAGTSDFGLLGTDYYVRKANAYFGRNWVPPGYMLDGYSSGFAGHVAGLENLLVGAGYDPGFADLFGGDYHLTPGSAAIDQGRRLAGSTLAYPLDRQYLAPHGSMARTTSGSAADLGAYENATYPLISNPGNQRNTGGDQVTLTIVAVGADTFAAVGLPPGLSIDNSGQISGTIDIQAAGTFDVVVSASDSASTNHVAFRWVVDLNEVNIPRLTNPGEQHSTGGDSVQLTIESDGADVITASGLPPGLVIDDVGTISGTISGEAFGNFDVVVTASNAFATSQVTFRWVVAANPDYVHQPPSDIDLSSAIVADRSLGAAVGLVTVTDADPDDTHTLVVSDARFEIVERQLRLKADKSLTMDTEPSVVVAITATDRYGLSLTQNFTISVVKIAVIDDGDAGFSTVGSGWTKTTSLVKGYQNDIRYVYAGDGKKTATWARTVAPGTYTIQASWTGYSGSVTNAPYRIYDGNVLLAEARFDQKRTPSYALNDPAAFMTIATVDVAGGNLRVVLGNDATGGTLVIADAVRIIPGKLSSIPDAVDGPRVVDDGEAGYAESSFGWYSKSTWSSGYQVDSRFADVGDGQSMATWTEKVAPGTYTVQAGWTGSSGNASDVPYRIYDGDQLLAEVRVDQKRNPTRAPGESVGFLTLAKVDINSGTLRVVLGNDATGGTQVMADAIRVVSGEITSPPSVVPGPIQIDDGDAGYTESAYGWYSIGSWTRGVESDSRFVAAGDGRSTATWAQTVAPGSYTVQASWYGNRSNVRNAPYRIYDGETLVREVRVDQRTTPAPVSGVPQLFKTLATVTINSGTLRVVLGNDATGGTLVEADAVRVVSAASEANAAAAEDTAKVAGTSDTARLPGTNLEVFTQACDELLGSAESVDDFAPYTSAESSRKVHEIDVKLAEQFDDNPRGLDSWRETDQSLSNPLGMFSELIVDASRSIEGLKERATAPGKKS